jgi:hypothetical protein
LQQRVLVATESPLITDEGEDESDDDGSLQDDDGPRKTICYSLPAFAVIQWRYDAGRGRFMPVDDVSDAEGNRPCPTVDMLNYHFADQNDIGFGCGTVEEYLAKFKSGEIPIEEALMPLIFDHPAVSALVKHADRDYGQLYEMVCPDARPIHHDRTYIEGFSLSTVEGLRRPTLYQLYEAAKELAGKYGLVNNQEFFKTSENKPRIRRDAPCDTGLRHVYLSTVHEASTRCQGVIDKLNEDDKVVIGGYVTREEDIPRSDNSPGSDNCDFLPLSTLR